MKNFLMGYGSILNIFSHRSLSKIKLNIKPKYRNKLVKSDKEAIQNDWEAIGNDIRRSINEYRNSNKE